MPWRSGSRTKSLAFPLFLLVVPLLGVAGLPHIWQSWRYWRAIQLSSTQHPQLATFMVPDQVFRVSSTTLPDLRVIDDLGNETPYAIRINDGEINDVPVPVTLLENSFAPGQYTQLVIDLGEAVSFHNSVEIQTNETDFIAWVFVEASDDAHVWRIVQPRAPFFRFHLQYHKGAQTIPYSENNARYLRIRILDTTAHFPVSGVKVFRTIETPPERAPFSVPFSPAAASGPNRSAWITDFGGLGAPVSEATFEVPAPQEFIRTVEIFASDDAKQWYRFAQAEIYRYGSGKSMQEELSVPIPFGGAQGRFWKVEIENGNDAPLNDVTLHLFARPRHVYFEEQPGRTYRLLYGRENAAAPEYDLDRRLTPEQEAGAIQAQVEAQEQNADYSDPRPWTEKHPYFLWVVIAVVVGLLGYSAAQALGRAGKPSQPS